MKIEEFLKRLSYGELSNLSMGNSGKGVIKEEDVGKIISYINEGLLRIYSQFTLLEKQVIVEMLDHITNYHLIPKYSECTGSKETYKYIKDLPGEPFIDDVIKILSIFDSETGYSYPLNDLGNAHSLFTPSPQTLQVPNPKQGVALSIGYQARHPILNTTGDNILNQNLDIPFVLEGSLQSYVAYKVFSHMNGQENAIKSQEHLSMFAAINSDVEMRDLINSSFATSHNKLEDRGFI